MTSITMQYDLRYRRLSRRRRLMGESSPKSFQRKSGPDARNGGRSSRAGAVRMGPSALYRRTGTVRSSVRSPHIVGSQRSAPRRHHCRPAPRFCSEMTVSAASAGRPPSLWVAAQRIWPVREGPAHSDGARQSAREGPLRRASPRAHAQLLFDTVLADAWLSALHGPNQPCSTFPPINRRQRLAPWPLHHWR